VYAGARCERWVARIAILSSFLGEGREEMISMKKAMLTVAMAAVGAFGCGIALGAEVNVKLSGDSEVPPVKSAGGGGGKIMVGDDGSISGSVTTTGMSGMAAHIHMGATGKNGPVILPLTKEGDTYKVPAGSKLNPEQMKAFKAGDLYVNVHTPENKGGELRGQLK
jgi:hypothetical protein